mmetsp:Transcript_6/g.16  ORF Transcript_6/g.16 Transcript_6/m.16 type:complete len:386 (+) Transcript_6:237-1394(+)
MIVFFCEKMDGIDGRMSEWRGEQHRVASQVVVYESVAPKNYHGDATRRFHSYAPHLRDFIKSFNKKKNSILVGGVDVSFPTDESEESIAVYAILEFTFDNNDNNDDVKISTIATDVENRVVYRSHKFFYPSVPYIPSYLAFRENDPLCELISSQIEKQPSLKPDVIMVDGNGQWHERRAGIACFVGVKTGIPTIGVGKTFYSLDGYLSKEHVLSLIRSSVESWYREHVNHESPVEKRRHRRCASGDIGMPRWVLIVDSHPISCTQDEDERLLATQDKSSPTCSKIKHATIQDMLKELHTIARGLAIPMQDDKGETLAYALVGHGGNQSNRDESGTKTPIYVSVGSHISSEDAVSLCALLSYVRIPEPVREADLYGRQVLREKGKK